MKTKNVWGSFFVVLITASTAFAQRGAPAPSNDYVQIKGATVEYQEGNLPPSSNIDGNWRRFVGMSKTNPVEHRLVIEGVIHEGNVFLENGRFTTALEGLENLDRDITNVNVEPIDFTSAAPISVTLTYWRRPGADAAIRAWAQDTRTTKKLRISLYDRANREARTYEFTNCSPAGYSNIRVSPDVRTASESLQLACVYFRVRESSGRSSAGQNIFLKWLSDSPRNAGPKRIFAPPQRSITIREIKIDSTFGRTIKYNGVKLLRYQLTELISDAHNELTESVELTADNVVFQ